MRIEHIVHMGNTFSAVQRLKNEPLRPVDRTATIPDERTLQSMQVSPVDSQKRQKQFMLSTFESL